MSFANGAIVWLVSNAPIDVSLTAVGGGNTVTTIVALAVRSKMSVI